MPSAHASEYCRRMPDGYEVPRWGRYLKVCRYLAAADGWAREGDWEGEGKGGKGTRAIVGGITK